MVKSQISEEVRRKKEMQKVAIKKLANNERLVT